MTANPYTLSQVNISEKNLLFLKKKSIAFVTHDYFSFTKDQIEELAKYFEKVYVFVRYKPIAEISRLIPISALKMHRKEYAIRTENLPENVSVFPVPLFYLPTDKSYINLGKKHLNNTLKIIRKNSIKFDIVHAHMTWTAGYVGLELSKIFQVPFVLTEHEYCITELPYKSEDWKKRIVSIITQANLNLTIATWVLEHYRNNGIFNPVSIIPYGFKPDVFFPEDKNKLRDKYNFPKEKKILINAALLEERKGHIYLIEAIEKIVSKGYDLLCIIIGEGDLKDFLIDSVKKKSLTKYIQIQEFKKSHHELKDMINLSDIFVLPSITEGFGVVQVESFALGVPVVATRNGASQDIITSEDYGLLSNVKDSEDFAIKLEEGLNRKWEPQKLIEYSKQFSWEQICKVIVSKYLEVLNA